MNKLLPTIDLPHQPLIEEAEFLESQLQNMMEGAINLMANQAIQCCMADFRIIAISEVTTETEPISNITV